MYVYTYTYTYVYIYICVCVCMYVCVCVCVCVLAALNEGNRTLLSGVRFLVVDEINHLSQRACLVVEFLSLVVENRSLAVQ